MRTKRLDNPLPLARGKLCVDEIELNDRLRLLAQKILQYLMEHPEAKDTIEGISRWWLDHPVDKAREDIQATLNWLVARGWMNARTTSPSENFYGLCQERREEIKTFLNEFEIEK